MPEAAAGDATVGLRGQSATSPVGSAVPHRAAGITLPGSWKVNDPAAAESFCRISAQLPAKRA